MPDPNLAKNSMFPSKVFQVECFALAQLQTVLVMDLTSGQQLYVVEERKRELCCGLLKAARIFSSELFAQMYSATQTLPMASGSSLGM